MKKWTYELIVVAALLVVGLGIWWWNSTKVERAANAQYEQFVKVAARQEVEIRIIRQAAELARMKQIIAENQKRQAMAVPQPVVIPQPPATVSPEDITKTE